MWLRVAAPRITLKMEVWAIAIGMRRLYRAKTTLLKQGLGVSQANPTLALDDGLARSATLTGEYDLVSIDQPVDNTITSDPLTELGYFTIAKKEISQVYQSSTTIHPNLDIAMRGDANELILRIEVVAVGNLPALEVSNFDFNTSGTTDLADIAKARLFFTGTSPVFSTVYQVGQTIVNPGSTFNHPVRGGRAQTIC